MIDFVRNNYKKIWFSIFVNFLICIICIIFFNCEFDTNDDVIIKYLASGGFGVNDYHLIYINSIIGTLLKIEYDVIGSICWYEILYYIATVVSLSLLCYVLINKGKNPFLVFGLLLLISREAYVNLQFTKVSSFLAIAGYLSISYYLNNSYKTFFIIGITLLVFSFMFRYQQFLAISAIMISIFFKDVFNEDNHIIKNKLYMLLKCGLITFVLILTTFVVNDVTYINDKWKSYKEYDRTRAVLLDREIPKYDENEYFFKNIGINKNSYEIFSDWNNNDLQLFGYDTLNKISSIKEIKRIDLNIIYTFIVSGLQYYFFRSQRILPYSCLTIFILLIFLILNKKKINTIIPIAFSFVMTFVCLFYVYYSRGTYVNRTNISYLIAFIIVIFYYYQSRNSKYTKVILLLSLLFVPTYYFSDLKIANNKETKITSIVQQLNSKDNNAYLFRVGTSLYNVDTLFDTRTKQFTNMIPLGGWTVNMPTQLRVQEKYNIKNPFEDIVDAENIYLVDDNADYIDKILQYIKDNYKKDCNAIATEELDCNYVVYRIVSKNN